MYNVNDTVVYGSQGVCKIVSMEKKNLGGEMKEYFVLKPIYDDRNTIFVPVDNAMLYSRLHHLLSSDEINKIIDEIPNEDFIWSDNENERKGLYKRVLSSGNREDVSKIIKTLHHHREEQQKTGKKLHSSDEYFLKEAEKLFYDEIATVLDIQPEEVQPFIFERIQAAACE